MDCPARLEQSERGHGWMGLNCYVNGIWVLKCSLFHVLIRLIENISLFFGNSACTVQAELQVQSFLPIGWGQYFIILKALTDHFGGGSRVVSFDPYS
jgi:hypothetical protein